MANQERKDSPVEDDKLLASGHMMQLCNTISQSGKFLNSYLNDKDLAQPGFDITSPSRLNFADSEAQSAQENILQATHELHNLLLGPFDALWALSVASDNIAGVAVISHFKIAQHVPLEGSISFEELALATGLPLLKMKRILRHAMTNFLFCEPEPGMVAHSAASRILLEDRLTQGLIGIACEEKFAAAAKTVETLEKYGETEEPNTAPWGVAHNAQKPFFEELATQYPDRAKRLGDAMGAMATLVPLNATKEYDWAKLGKAKVVDVGGARGPVSISLAREFPDLSFVVQDLEDIVVEGQRELPEDLKERIEFMPHDFFTAQPVKNADVYYYRGCFHNWPDKYAVRILQALIPALKSGARVVIQDVHMPKVETLTPWQRRRVLSADFGMMLLFNAHEREEGEWADLFEKADGKFRFTGLNVPPAGAMPAAIGTVMVTIEAIWDG